MSKLRLIAALFICASAGWLIYMSMNSSSVPAASPAIDVLKEAPQLPQSLVKVDSSRYRRISPEDTGTIRIYLRNDSNAPVSVKQVRMNDYPIPVWNADVNEHSVPPSVDTEAAVGAGAISDLDVADEGAQSPVAMPSATAEARAQLSESLIQEAASQQVIWAKFMPRVLAPGEVGEFSAKLRRPLTFASKFDLVTNSGEEILQVVRPEMESAVISAITFSADLSKLYAYMQSRCADGLNISSIEVNGKNATDRAWFTSKTIAPGEKQLAVVSLQEALRQTDYVTVKVVAGNVVMQDRVKAFSGFPIHVQRGSGLGAIRGSLDQELFAYDLFPDSDVDCSVPQIVGTERAICLLNHLNHVFGQDWTKAAQVTLKRQNLCLQQRPDLITYVHVCRNGSAMAFPRFGELADAMEMSPAYCLYGRKAKSAKWKNELETFEYARQSISPRPVFAVLSNERYNKISELCTAAELRQRAFAIVAQAPRAILYRWNNPKGAEATLRAHEAEARNINLSLAAVREYLAIADTIPKGARVLGEAPVSGQLLLAGDRAAVLVLHNDETSSGTPGDCPSVQISLSLPGVLGEAEVTSVMHLTPEGPTPMAGAISEGIITLPAPALAEAYLLPLKIREEQDI